MSFTEKLCVVWNILGEEETTSVCDEWAGFGADSCEASFIFFFSLLLLLPGGRPIGLPFFLTAVGDLIIGIPGAATLICGFPTKWCCLNCSFEDDFLPRGGGGGCLPDTLPLWTECL